MARTRSLMILIMTAFVVHAGTMSRISLPSQDGIKFIAIAKSLSSEPVWDVIRSVDQHPLYPMMISMIHPIFSLFRLSGPDSWRLAAQLVSLFAALATLWPLYAMTSRLYRPVTALLAVFLWLVLPMPFVLGHETLSDALSLCLSAWALFLAIKTMETKRAIEQVILAIATGCLVSAAYWTRPEGLLSAVSVLFVWLTVKETQIYHRPQVIAVFLSCVVCLIGIYVCINGNLTRKWQLSKGIQVAGTGDLKNLAQMPRGLPEALRDPRYDFSPKDPNREVGRAGLANAAFAIFRQWGESLGDILAVMTLWGLFRCRSHHASARKLITIHVVVLLSALILHAALRGYLSSRHVVGLTFLSVPHAAAALRLCALRFAWLCRLPLRTRKIGTNLAYSLIGLTGLILHAKPVHESRQPHYQAAQWLSRNAPAGAAVYDTRGWASFQSNLRRYDPQHFPQAVSDSNTRFWVLEQEELSSGSRRAITLGSILADGGQLVARFSSEDGQSNDDVLVFAWNRPAWWDRPMIHNLVEKSRTVTPEPAKQDQAVQPAGQFYQGSIKP